MWVVDSCAIDHIMRDCDLFVHFCNIFKGTKLVNVGNNAILEVGEIGTCKVSINKWKNLVPIDKLHIPMIHKNLVFVTCLLYFRSHLDFPGDVLNIQIGNDILCNCSLCDGLLVL